MKLRSIGNPGEIFVTEDLTYIKKFVIFEKN